MEPEEIVGNGFWKLFCLVSIIDWWGGAASLALKNNKPRAGNKLCCAFTEKQRPKNKIKYVMLVLILKGSHF